MEQTTSYRYEALNDGSYNELVEYAINLVGNVSLFPAKRTIVIEGRFLNDVGKFIDKAGLDFHITPIEVHDEDFEDVISCETIDAETLRYIIFRLLDQKGQTAKQNENIMAEIAKDRDRMKKDRDLYMQWYMEKSEKVDRIKSQVQAVAVLFNGIFPKEG